MEICFLSTQPRFPVPEHDKDSIDTMQFLEASRGLVRLVERFGILFEPVKKDLNQNIENLHRKYEENIDVHRCLLRMVLSEFRNGETSATISLLWLRSFSYGRLQALANSPIGLKLMAEFLTEFLENERKNVLNENMSGLFHKAYENSLKPHHNFLLRCLFKMLCTRCPTRTDLLNILGYSHFQDDESFLSMLSQYLSRLESNLNALSLFCKAHDITPHC